jgi:hypothetical protein
MRVKIPTHSQQRTEDRTSNATDSPDTESVGSVLGLVEIAHRGTSSCKSGRAEEAGKESGEMKGKASSQYDSGSPALTVAVERWEERRLTAWRGRFECSWRR